MPDVDPLEFRDGSDWESWLEVNHSTETEAWLRIGKKNSGVALLSITDALDGALCFGWIDGHRRGLDEVSFLQRYSPRRKRSSWSQVNVSKVEALLAAGRMRPPGLAEVELAQADGRWQAAYESQRTAQTPPDLALALAANPVAESGIRAPWQDGEVRRDPADPQGQHPGRPDQDDRSVRREPWRPRRLRRSRQRPVAVG